MNKERLNETIGMMNRGLVEVRYHDQTLTPDRFMRLLRIERTAPDIMIQLTPKGQQLAQQMMGERTW